MRRNSLYKPVALSYKVFQYMYSKLFKHQLFVQYNFNQTKFRLTQDSCLVLFFKRSVSRYTSLRSQWGVRGPRSTDYCFT